MIPASTHIILYISSYFIRYLQIFCKSSSSLATISKCSSSALEKSCVIDINWQSFDFRFNLSPSPVYTTFAIVDNFKEFLRICNFINFHSWSPFTMCNNPFLLIFHRFLHLVYHIMISSIFLHLYLSEHRYIPDVLQSYSWLHSYSLSHPGHISV